MIRMRTAISLLVCLLSFVSSFAPADLKSYGPNRALTLRRLTLSPDDQALAAWVFLFSSSHIGMSAVRESLIERCGQLAEVAGIVGKDIKLPDYWPGDSKGGNVLFPDQDIAGRQVYRVGYTAVSFITLGSAFSCYLATRDTSPLVEGLSTLGSARSALFTLASAAEAVSLASLANPSPLSLVPGFSEDAESPLKLRRDDSLKLSAVGLTRITRHPLILPVVPWGLANAALVGGRVCDALLFGGLAVYAIAGCAAQDARAARAEQIGTVFSDGDLRGFYETTSFLPFGAILDGRQSLDAAVSEVPWFALAAGYMAGCAIETATLNWLGA
mmetsp:Transcript_2130/g.4575  ORF Transcript_2130/g.4575 Transcript_2130/m.4575 type:complete len:329 (+) Transcript_2130:28-1014(+)